MAEKKGTDLLPIGDLARRTGLSLSAIRYYEARGLVTALRTAGGQRRFARSDIRRLSFILIAQKLGMSLDAIQAELAKLPKGRTPGREDWARISTAILDILDQQIGQLQRTRDNLDGCVGCGCLSLDRCALYNPGDSAAARGPGPRYVMGGEWATDMA